MDLTRRTLMGSAALAVGALAAPPTFEMEEATVADLQKRMSAGSLTASALTQRYLERIAAIDKRGPALNSVIELNPDALSIAAALDAERKAKGPRGPLHGIPVLIKDNIDTADRMMTTAGSLALVGSIAARDAIVAQRLRAAGAVLLGKTNLSEWANFRSSHSTSGWSGRGGLTRNPYALDRNACGSSSGSGAAVSANLCALAIGTETDGSIVCPASTNGVVGIKPTLGLIPATGIIPIAHSQDTAGPMARTVADAALLLGVLTGADYTKSLDPNGLRGARIGVARDKFFGFSEETERVIEAAIAEMKRRGAEIVDPADIPTAGKFDDSESEVLSYEFKNDLNLYLGALVPKAPMHSLADVIAFNAGHRSALEQGVSGRIREGSPALTHRRHRRGDEQASSGCLGSAHCRPGLVYGLDQWRPRPGRQFHARRRRRLPEYQCPRGLCLGPAGGHLLLRRGEFRAAADQAGVRFRAGHAAPARAAIPAPDTVMHVDALFDAIMHM